MTHPHNRLERIKLRVKKEAAERKEKSHVRRKKINQLREQEYKDATASDVEG